MNEHELTDIHGCLCSAAMLVEMMELVMVVLPGICLQLRLLQRPNQRLLEIWFSRFDESRTFSHLSSERTRIS